MPAEPVRVDLVRSVLTAVRAAWSTSDEAAARRCAALLEAALGREAVAEAWGDPDGLRCSAPEGLGLQLSDAAANVAADSAPLADTLRALGLAVDELAWKEPKQLVSAELQPDSRNGTLDLDALLGGPGRFKSAMMVGSTRYGAVFESTELLMGLTYLAPGTFYPQHAHDAAEVYQMLLGTGRWGQTPDMLVEQPPGSFVIHPAALPHTIEAPASNAGTAAVPLLAFYAWTGRLDGKFWFCNCHAGDQYIPKLWGPASISSAPEDCYDLMAPEYERVVRGWGYRLPEVAADALEGCVELALTTEGVRVLDLGCGDGLVGSALYGRGYRHIDGVDISQAMLRQAEQRGCYNSLHKADLRQDAVLCWAANSSYDALLCIDTTSYLEPTVLREWLRVVRSNGVLILSHQSSVWPLWVEAQAALVAEGAWVLLWESELGHYLPSLPRPIKQDHGDELAKVWVYRTL